MPLVIMSGQPCSGKSSLAAKLAASFRELNLETHVIDEPSLHLQRNTAYKGEVCAVKRHHVRCTVNCMPSLQHA